MPSSHKGDHMKFLVRNYRSISITLSLFILALAFVVGSTEEWRNICVPLAFFLGFVMYAVGGIRAWKCGLRVVGAVEIILMVCLWAAFVFSIVSLGGRL